MNEAAINAMFPVCPHCGSDVPSARLLTPAVRLGRSVAYCSASCADAARRERWLDKPGNRERARANMRRLRAQRKVTQTGG